MNKAKLIPLLTVILVVSFLMVTCKHELPDNGNTGGIVTPPTQTGNCSTDSIYFVNDIQPLINSNCATSGCHDATTRAEGVELTSYSKIRNYVVPFNAAASKIYKESIKTNNDRMPPPPMPALTAGQLAKLVKWINQGALNNQCTGGCDTTLFTYAAAVMPLMNNYCKGCHNPLSLGGNIDLSTYATVKTQALNGKLMGSIQHSAGFSAMPKGGSKFLDCQITQVQKWITAGALNN